MKLVASEQVRERLRTLHPTQRKQVREALDALADGRGDVKELSGSLAGYFRLRVGRYRAVFSYRGQVVEVIFLEQRSVVYELFRP